MGARHIRQLDKIEEGAYTDLLLRIREARARIARMVTAAARAKGYAISGSNRDLLYARINGQYAKLEVGLRKWSDELVTGSVRAGHEEAVRDIQDALGETAEKSITRFDRKYAEDVFRMIHPAQDKNLAAVFTARMAEADISALRTATVQTFRQAALEGWTMRTIRTNLRARWDGLAGDMAADRFVDAAGRQWGDGRYLQMLVRTTVARADREGYLDTITKAGDDLIRVINMDGDACAVCTEYDGVILSVTGSSTKFESVEDAKAAGLWHPNCRCLTERVDEDIDADEIKKQAGGGEPSDVEADDA